MVSSGVVDYDPRDGIYALPREHAAFLTISVKILPFYWFLEVGNGLVSLTGR
jgi:hypothetical protein